jgi:isoleucyl-tRNA synthetase
VIGKSLEADIRIVARNGSVLDLLERHKDGLKELMNVSDVAVRELEPEDQLPESQRTSAMWPLLNHDIEVLPAAGQKCARCWNFMPDTADYGIWHDVCGRCRDALKEMGIAPPSPHPTDQNPSAGTPTPEAAQ